MNNLNTTSLTVTAVRGNNSVDDTIFQKPLRVHGRVLTPAVAHRQPLRHVTQADIADIKTIDDVICRDLELAKLRPKTLEVLRAKLPPDRGRLSFRRRS